jgi:phosphoglycerate dehydrogenase-like enzyme
LDQSHRKVVISRVGRSSVAQELLTKAGLEVSVGPKGWLRDDLYANSELSRMVAGADALLVSPFDRVESAVLESSETLQTVVCPVIGVDKIDVEAATRHGVLVCNSPAPENFIGLAEATVGLIVALFKRLKTNEASLREGEGYQFANRGVLMTGKTVGLVGFGRVARETAKRLQHWGLRMIAADPYVEPRVGAEFGVELMPLERLLRESDLVSIHVVLNAETRNLIALRELRMMKPTAYLVNTARGGVVNEDDLVRALKEGIIAGAALDVSEIEPLPKTSTLRGVDPRRLILTPHIIGHDMNVEEPGERMAAETIRSILSGQTPTTIVNRDAIARWRSRFWS